MASGDPEIKGGFSISQWMRAKPSSTKTEFEPFAASPPPYDESFFYIRYPKAEGLFPVPKAKSEEPPTIVVQEPAKIAAAPAGKEVDWTKHTKSCQDVLHGFSAPITNTIKAELKLKPAGTDDGFKGEGAACGSSVLKVAHKMVSSQSVSRRGFTVATPAEDDAEPPPPSYNLAARRGSRSLPASPLHSPPGSPNSRRRRNFNHYFTSPFEPSDAINKRSWLTAALLGYKKESDLNGSTSTLVEEDIHPRLQGGSLVASVENLGPAPRAKERDTHLSQSSLALTQEPKLTKPAPSFKPKPTEFRELNFWSPTSM